MIRSRPSGVPVMPKASVYVFPEEEILVGVALASLAVPPSIDNAKSDASSAPLPPVAL